MEPIYLIPVNPEKLHKAEVHHAVIATLIYPTLQTFGLK
jgi:hypothetical protein